MEHVRTSFKTWVPNDQSVADMRDRQCDRPANRANGGDRVDAEPGRLGGGAQASLIRRADMVVDSNWEAQPPTDIPHAHSSPGKRDGHQYW
jgi:hypothetical protein